MIYLVKKTNKSCYINQLCFFIALTPILEDMSGKKICKKESASERSEPKSDVDEEPKTSSFTDIDFDDI